MRIFQTAGRGWQAGLWATAFALLATRPAWAAGAYNMARFKWVLLGSFVVLSILLVLVLIKMWQEFRGEREYLIAIPSDLLSEKHPYVQKGKGSSTAEAQMRKKTSTLQADKISTDVLEQAKMAKISSETQIYQGKTAPQKFASEELLSPVAKPAARKLDDPSTARSAPEPPPPKTPPKPAEPPPGLAYADNEPMAKARDEDPWQSLLKKVKKDEPATAPSRPLPSEGSLDDVVTKAPTQSKVRLSADEPPRPAEETLGGGDDDAPKRKPSNTAKINKQALRLELSREKRDTDDLQTESQGP